MAAPLSKRSLLLLQCVKRGFHPRTVSNNANRNGETEQPKTHFGFQSVNEDEKEEKVYEVFEQVATKYDLMNDAMSGGIHRVWKDIFMSRLSPTPGTKLVDVAGGTGDIALRFLKYVGTQTDIAIDTDFELPRDVTAQVFMDPGEGGEGSTEKKQRKKSSLIDGDYAFYQPADESGSHVTVCDINQPMLEVGKDKAQGLGYHAGISWVQGNAECLPLDDDSFDAYTIAFGIRNCTHVQKVLNDAYRILKPGGRFMCLEFSEVKNPLLRGVYDSYSFQVIPVMGQLIAGDWKSYQYLVESIRQFPNQEDFSDMIKAAGFRMVTHENLTFGVAAIHSGFKI